MVFVLQHVWCSGHATGISLPTILPSEPEYDSDEHWRIVPENTSNFLNSVINFHVLLWRFLKMRSKLIILIGMVVLVLNILILVQAFLK